MATQGNEGTASALNSFVGVMNTTKENRVSTTGTSEAVSRVTASMPTGTHEYHTVASQQLFNREKLRSVSVLFGIGEERPKSPSPLAARLKHNLQFFYLNYMLMTGILFFLTLLISPSAIIGMGLLAALWVYVIRQTQDGSMKICGLVISQTHATIALSIFSTIALIWILGGVFWWINKFYLTVVLSVNYSVYLTSPIVPAPRGCYRLFNRNAIG